MRISAEYRPILYMLAYPVHFGIMKSPELLGSTYLDITSGNTVSFPRRETQMERLTFSLELDTKNSSS